MTEQEPKPYEATHYVVFMVDGEAYYTDAVPESIAHILADSVGGIVCPTELDEILKGGDESGKR